MISFQTSPGQYRHWQLSVADSVATLCMNVDSQAGLFDGYALKLNSYDLGVDIELADAVNRLRFEQPQVRVVLITSAQENVFCAGANIRMLAGADHGHKVNFCKFTNETRCAMENVGAESGQFYVSVIQGACAGGGYELALATDHLLLADDSISSVSLPEVPLLAVLPGTGGLTRLTDKRRLRRDLADVFCTLEEGVKGQRALDWNLVDEISPRSSMETAIQNNVQRLSAISKKTGVEKGIALSTINRMDDSDADNWRYTSLSVHFDRNTRCAELRLSGPDTQVPDSADDLCVLGDNYWALRMARELDEALLNLRFNEPMTGVLVYKTSGDVQLMAEHVAWLMQNQDHWLVNEILLLWTRVFKRIDLMARSQVALLEPGSCFAGFFAEIAFACDRSYMLIGQFDQDNQLPAQMLLCENNYGLHPMANGLSRLQTRFPDDPDIHSVMSQHSGQLLDAEMCEDLGLVTFAYDDIDWEDEVRVFLEERASFSADALSAMEANLRSTGPETMETRIFGRLTAWQNWVFQRPNAVGEHGALKRYGSGQRADYDQNRV